MTIQRKDEKALAIKNKHEIQRNVDGIVVALSPPLAWIPSVVSIRQSAAGSVSAVWPGVSLPCLGQGLGGAWD